MSERKVIRLGKFSEDNEPKETTPPSKIATSGKSEVNITLVSLKDIEQYLYAHPVVPMGIEKKANRIINRGYTIPGRNEKARKYCEELLKKSGGSIFIKNWTKDAYGFGNSYAELVPNKTETKILKVKQKHPVYFSHYKEESKEPTGYGKQWVIKIKNGKPIGFTQWKYETGGTAKPTGDVIPANKVAHLVFDTWGDEIEGISLVQYVYNTITYLLNIEEAGAETMYRNGFVQKKFTTNLRTGKALKKFAKSVNNVNERDYIILTEGTDVENLQPGETDFVPYHQEFLKLLAIRLGIPKPLLTMDATCHSEDTEYLCEDGWKKYYEYKDDDKIAVYDKESDEIKFEKPKDFMIYDYEGKLIEFENKCTSALVTPNHKMLFRPETRGAEFRTLKAKELIEKHKWYNFKTDAKFKGQDLESFTIPGFSSRYHNISTKDETFEIKEFLRFLGWYFSEGCSVAGQVRITQQKGTEKCKEIRRTLDRLGLDFWEYLDDRDDGYKPRITFRVRHIGIAKYLSKFGKVAQTKTIPKWIMQLPEEKIKIFLNSFLKGDGHIMKNGHKSYCTSSKKMADDIQFLLFRIGKKSSLIVENNGMYTISEHKNGKGYTRLSKKKHVQKLDYKGDVWCFETSTGFFVTRRNGKIAIQGNSTNKATIQSQKDDMYEDSYADELIIKQTIDNQIFKPALKYTFPDLSEEEYPEFRFLPRKIDKDKRIKRMQNYSEAIKNISDSVRTLTDAGKTEEANQILGDFLEDEEGKKEEGIRATFEEKPDGS